VPKSFVTPGGGKLGGWVYKQRSARKGMHGGLSEERTARLEASGGFVWDPQDAAWGESYRRLEAYRAEQEDCVPGHVAPGGRWQPAWGVG